MTLQNWRSLNRKRIRDACRWFSSMTWEQKKKNGKSLVSTKINVLSNAIWFSVKNGCKDLKGFAGASANCKKSVTLFSSALSPSLRLLMYTFWCEIKWNPFFFVGAEGAWGKSWISFWFDIWSLQEALTPKESRKIKILYRRRKRAKRICDERNCAFDTNKD